MSVIFRFQEESFRDGYKELAPLLPAYYAEVSCLRDTAPLDPDRERYRILEESGQLLYLTARTPDGILAGFFLAILGTHGHSQHAFCAFSDGWYLAPAYRGGGGKAFLEAIEYALRRRGVGHLLMACTLMHDLDSLYQRAGLKPFERVYYKHLGAT